MKFEPKHLSLIGVGITAVAAIAGILYYRGQAQQASSDANNATQGFGSFPYFQSAALPSSIDGSSTTGTSATSTSSGSTPTIDVNALDRTSFAQTIISQINQGLSQSGNPAALTRGYVTDTGNGLNFGFLSLPITSPRPLDEFINQDPFSTSANLTYSPAKVTGSTNSTLPASTMITATQLPDGTIQL